MFTHVSGDAPSTAPKDAVMYTTGLRALALYHAYPYHEYSKTEV